MTDEKKPAELNPGGAETGSQAPDELRRKLAKAALVAPVIMTLGPRSVLSQTNDLEPPTPACSVSVLSSIQGRMVSASQFTKPDFTECQQCLDDLAQYNSTNGDEPDLPPEHCVKK